MSKFTYIIAIDIIMTAFLFMSQIAMGNLSDEFLDGTSTEIINYENSHIKNFNKGPDGTYILNTDVNLPDQRGEVETTDGNSVFTDTFSAIKDWLLQVTRGNYILGVLNALPNAINLIFPTDMAAIGFAIGYMWHAVSAFMLVFWLKGGTN